MIVRCGACRTQFEVPGAGRFACPACGSVNQVRSGPGGGAPGPMGSPPTVPPTSRPPTAPPPPPPAPDPPSPRMTCPECDFTFIVGEIEVATCPNCGTEVSTGWEEA